MVVRFTVQKVPKSTPLVDIPINFEKVVNPHFELIEVKDKLRKGLPLIQPTKERPDKDALNWVTGVGVKSKSEDDEEIPQKKKKLTILRILKMMRLN